MKCGLGRAGEPPVAFVLGVIALGALHLGYYLGVLNTSEEHRVLQEQWHIDWSLSAPSMLFAYVPVGLLVAWRIRSGARFVETFADPRNRLLGVWFLVSLALANHDLLIDPVQPLHFTRGYVWMPLFLLGAPVLVAALARLLELRLGAALAAAVMLLALSDNMTWLGRFAYDRAVNGKTWGFTLPHEVRDVFALLNRPEYRDALVVSNLPVLGYISTVYTPLRAWWSHGANTPHTDRRRAEVQRFFVRGAAPAEWSTRPLVVLRLVNDNRRWPLLVERLGLVHVFGTRYEVYYRPRLSAPARG